MFGRSAAPDETVTMVPPPLSVIGCSTARDSRYTAVRLASSVACQSCGVIKARLRGPTALPALLTRMSTVPKSARTQPIRASTALGCVISAARAKARPPVALIASAASCRSASLRPTRTTEAPSSAIWRAISRPMPVPAPVTTATRPFSLAMVISSSSFAASFGGVAVTGFRAFAGHQTEAEILGDQFARAVGRVSPAAAAGQLHGQPCAGLEWDVALGEDRLAVLEYMARSAILAADDSEAGVLHMLAGEVNVHLRWRDVAEDQALTEPAPELPGSAGIGDQLLAFEQRRNGKFVHLRRRDAAIGGEAQRVDAVGRGASALPAMQILRRAILLAQFVLALAVDAPDRRAAAVALDPVRHDAFERTEDQARDDMADEIAQIARRRVARVENRARRRLVGDRQHAAFIVRRL